jgi:hypothetical protein
MEGSDLLHTPAVSSPNSLSRRLKTPRISVRDQAMTFDSNRHPLQGQFMACIVFWNVKTCSPIQAYRRFGGIYCLTVGEVLVDYTASYPRGRYSA